jgi:hypothetical protein
MPIRINLLAEAQAAEELRRRDPVKRVIIAGVLLLAIMAVWGSTVQLKVMLASRELGQAQYQLDAHKTDYDTAITNNAKIAAIKLKIAALEKMSDARMLQGNLLNALQKVTVSNVQVTRIKVDQAYVISAPARGQTGKTTVTEKTVVTLSARDSSSNPGDQVGKFMDALSRADYFRGVLSKTNAVVLTDESPAQQDGGDNFVLFTLECHFPDQKR